MTLTPFTSLVTSKAWDLLGMTGEEFKRAWWSGEFTDDLRPEVRAMDALMRTGHWEWPPAPESPR